MSPHPLRLLISSYSLALVVALILPGAGLVTQALVFWLGGAGFVAVLAMTPGIRAWFTADLDASLPGSHGDLHPDDPDLEYRQWDEDARIEAANHNADAETPQDAGLAGSPKKRRSA
ncbi:MAG: hypothetical protein AAGD47_09060 [Pseudomonadota bacterium]